MKEIWKPINGFEGKYEVSNYGRVKSLDRFVKGKGLRFLKGRILKPQVASGYAQVYLLIDGKQKWFKIHRLVAETFLPNPNNYPIVNHIDCNTLNNIVWVNDDGSVDFEKSNLEWCTISYNLIYGIIKRNNLDVSVENYHVDKLAYQREYSKTHKKERKEYSKKYYQKNREKILKKYHENKTSSYLYKK